MLGLPSVGKIPSASVISLVVQTPCRTSIRALSRISGWPVPRPHSRQRQRLDHWARVPSYPVRRKDKGRWVAVSRPACVPVSHTESEGRVRRLTRPGPAPFALPKTWPKRTCGRPREPLTLHSTRRKARVSKPARPGRGIVRLWLRAQPAPAKKVEMGSYSVEHGT